ncbi:MAG: hypothetical protein WCA49_16270 [Candidatus Sulfotelmatobacter sp.]
MLRILLGKIGAEWRATLAELARPENDLEIVGRVDDALDILLQTEELKPDVVVLAQPPGGGEPGVCSHLMLEHPNVAVLLLPTSSGSRLCGAWCSARRAGIKPLNRRSMRH